MDKWTLPDEFVSNWEKVGIEFTQLALAQAEKFVVELVKAGEGITEKAYKVLAIAISILTGSLIYITTLSPNATFVIASIISALLSIASIVVLKDVLLFYNTYVIGSPPKMLLRKEFIANFKTGESQLKNLYISECVNYQERIDLNLSLNIKRAKRVRIAIYLLFFVPFSLLAGRIADVYLF